MTESVTNYRIYCLTEGDWVYGWGTEQPTACYNNDTHSVNPASVQDMETISHSIVSVREEKVPTGGNIAMKSFTFDVLGPTGAITYYESVFPFPISMLSTQIHPRPENIGDSFYSDVGNHTTIGALMEPLGVGVTGGVTGFAVSSTVVQYLNLGYYVTLTDGVNTSELGRCIMIDKTNSKISTEFPTTHSFSPLSPTYVQQTVKMADPIDIVNPYNFTLGDDKIGASYVPANMVGRFCYKNNDGKPKKFTFLIEYLY